MSVDIILKDIEWDGVNKIRVPLEGGGTQDFSIGGGTATLQTKSKAYTPTASQQTDTIQADNGYDGLDTVNITVNAIDPNFIGSNIPRKSSADLTVSGKTVTAPSGYYSAQASKSVADGTEGTPTATKGTVSNHSVTVTPSVTNSAGYIQGGTKTGNGVIVTATELASGNLPITENADNINVVGYASVSVNVPTNLQTKTRTFTPTFSQQVEVIGPDSGYYGLNAVGITVEAVQMMSLPRVASLTSTGSRRARIYQSNATQYWNIPEGYHTEAEYYEVAPLNVAPKIITANGNYNAGDEDLDGYSSVSVNVQGGIGTLLATKSLGTISTNSTTATDTGQTVSVSGINNYDLLVVETSVDTKTNNRHASTMQCIWLTASSTIGTKSGSAIATATMNDKLSSNGTATSRSNTTKYGIYVYSVSISNGSATLTMYERYNSTQTGTINGSYTTRVYGVNLYNLIGG